MDIYSFSIHDLEVYLLIMTRVTCFLMIAPFFQISNTPRRVKIGLGLFVAFLLYQSLGTGLVPSYSGLLEYVTLMLKEAVVGLVIGFGAYICMSIVLFAGSVVDMEMGFSMVNQMDPTTKEYATITGVYYQNVFLLLLIITGMYRFLLEALAETYQLIPLGNMVWNADHLLSDFIVFLGDFMIIGMRICLPVFCTIMLVNAVLGILAKIAPSLNMFVVGLQLKILAGLAVLFLTAGMLPAASEFVLSEMKKMMVSFAEGMM